MVLPRVQSVAELLRNASRPEDLSAASGYALNSTPVETPQDPDAGIPDAVEPEAVDLAADFVYGPETLDELDLSGLTADFSATLEPVIEGRIGTDLAASNAVVDEMEMFQFGEDRVQQPTAGTPPVAVNPETQIVEFPIEEPPLTPGAESFRLNVDLPTSEENGGFPVHPVSCACGPCCGQSQDHDVDTLQNLANAFASDGGDAPTPQEGGPSDGFTISTISTSGDNAIDSLLQSYRWGSGSGTVEMTYSFGTSSSVYISGYSEPSNGFGEFSDHQKAATRSALDYWSNVANINFTEVTDSASVAGDLRFAKSSDPSTAWAYLPTTSPKGGDVWVGPSSYYNDMSEGTYGFATMLHEIGHALGLMHTHQGSTIATSDIDWTGYSIMSYRSYENAPLTGYTQSYYPTTPMINDVKAIQHIYGANTSHNTGDTTYSWTTGGRVLETIWDAGGTDTIDWSNQSSAAEINLNSGVWSKLGPTYYSKFPTTEDRTLMIAENAVIENATGGSGNDTITGNAVANVLTGGAGNDTLSGGDGNDTLIGGDGNDTLIGGTGSDTLNGGDGNDTYIVSDSNATIQEGSSPSNGTDTLQTSVSYTLGGSAGYGIENIELTLSSDINITAGNIDNTITGNAGANVITGGGGDDTITGGSGNDRFVFAAGFGNDTITDFTMGNGSVDTLDFSSYGYSYYSEIQNNISFADVNGNAVLTLGSDTLTLTGVSSADLHMDDFFGVVAGATEGDDTLTGSSGDNVIDGLGGNDTLSGGDGNDLLRGGTGNDTVNGDAGNDTLYGDAGEDTLTGGGGDDALHGGSGRDVFVFSLGEGNDTIHDFQVGFDKINLSGLNVSDFNALLGYTQDVGSDAVITRSIYTLTLKNISKAQFQQSDFIGVDPVGTSGNDTLIGFDTDDAIDGLAGNDTINGAGGNDTLTGGDGNDRLIGGTGDDSMSGGTGDDTYVVDSTSDTVTESSGEGTDTVEASATFTLGSNVENLTLTGASAINGTGNSAANTIKGNSGDNVLTGNGGTDSIFGFGGDDTLNGGSSFDSLIGGDGADTVNAGDGADWIRGEAGNDILSGEGGNDKIFGEAGNDTLDGGTGNDIMTGGTGDDIYVYDGAGDRAIENADEGTDTIQSTANYTVLADNIENLTLTGSGNISGMGNNLDNTITGNSGNNVLTGGGGNDTLIGGEGSDTYMISDNTDTITEGTAAAGTDKVISSITYSIATDYGIEDLELSLSGDIDGTGNVFDNTITGNSGANTLTGQQGNDTLYGMAGNDSLVGGSGNDTLDGGTGTDSLTGGTGDDTYIMVDQLDTITENASEGTDTVNVYFNYTLGSNLENLVLAGASHINGTGNADDNTITGNSARNTIDGGTGADTMAGGGGDDTYYVDNVSDTVTENSGQGTDRVFSSVTFTIGANIENLTLTGSSDINAYGNTSDNALTGNSGANILNGNSGNDTLFGFAGNDTITGGNGTDSLYGDAGTDTLNGGAGNDALRGGAGRDTFAFSSGFGDDTIHDFTVGFDSIDLTGLGVGTYTDLLSNTTDSGSDAVITISGNTITLSNVLKASLQAGDFIGLTPGATSGNDTMNGLSTADNLDGGDGNDTIYGNGGADTLAGGAGNDYIDGGAAADAMSGGTGDDTFVVNHNGDTVTENASEGTDTVLSETHWTLGANVENLTLTGSSNLNGSGHSGNNVIHGNSGDNVLTGNGGNDSLFGNAGDDTLNGGSTWDSLIGGTGNDTVNGGGGNDWIRGEDGNDTLNGQDGRDRMFGEAGNDRLVGGNGQDTMAGGAGDDIFEYDALSELGDTITDFETGANADQIDLITLLTAVGYGGSDALGDGRVRAQQSGADTIVEIDTSGSSDYARIATLQNVTATELIADNWIFS